MTLQDLVQLYGLAPQVEALRNAIEEKPVKTIFLQGLVASSAPMLFSSVNVQCSALYILNDEEEAGYFYNDLKQMVGEDNVLFFPSSFRRAIKYAQRDAANEILRTEVLTRLSSLNTRLSIVTYPEALAEQVIGRQQLEECTLVLRQGQTIIVDEVVKTLRDLDFHEVDYVYEPGQFALRGSILDVYSFSSEYPFRIDFFGDDIDTIRTFEVEDQLSRDKRDTVSIVAGEPSQSSLQREDLPNLPPQQGGPREVTLLSYLREDTILITKDFSFVRDAIDRICQEANPEEVQVISGTQWMGGTTPFRKIEFGSRPSAKPEVSLTFQITPQPLLHKNFDLLRGSFADYQSKGYHLYVLADSQKQLERLMNILSSQQETAAANDPHSSFNAQLVNYVDKAVHAGFIDHDLRLCIFTDHEIFDRFHRYHLRSERARNGKAALTLKEIQQFEVGDYIVHVDHGIGKFGGLVRMPIQDPPKSPLLRGDLPVSPPKQGESERVKYQEMIKIIYQGGGAIYVSIHSLYKVSKYKAQDSGEPPRLSQLGTGQWERMKERTKNKLKDIARDLIKLYAARKREKGFAFSADNFMQHELEASFLYEDTPDQLKTTNEVKADMEQGRPMDRLVCGDVGFGKTEIAVRAAFKAACDSKQVAVLVPTTVLAYQHFQTFQKRLKNLPVRVDYLTRARTPKQTKEILQDLADGKIDILIGTHKLIGKSVRFKDLGLLIIDEEQKFGVSTKEKLRQMRTNVDTLTLTATPIPRTLQFSLMGARDLSIIQTPPPNRYPIQTEIHVLGPEIIAEAINFEMSRNGQVYFVNPRINDLQRIADMIRTYVPDARIAIGHGQMKPDELERIVFDFINYDYDVLLSTTIIENGIDIPNANTIIINGAHHFGLSDLHQMRGRVGRGNRKAYCYLLAPPLADLPQESRRRLEALETFSELGSGIQIAMQDLDIRGAGNLLGAEQSGFIADLGYETYQKILNQAMAELRREEDPSKSPLLREDLNSTLPEQGDVEGVFDLPLYFPDQYVPSDSERMLLYRELDNLHTDEQLVAYRKRLIDRFGPVPQEGEELMRVVPLRRVAGQLGCEKLMLKQGRMTLYFVSDPNHPFYQSPVFDAILQYVAMNPRRCQFRDVNGKRSLLISDTKTVESALNLLKGILSLHS
ncbi:MAG: transcription-repair coupling factor [Prevotella sp.]|nr:transcription-repair coupling factor [Prevotella sp.]